MSKLLDPNTEDKTPLEILIEKLIDGLAKNTEAVMLLTEKLRDITKKEIE